MKPGLAVLPMDVWADVFVYPWISRQQLAQIVDRFKERAFAEKLQKFLHDPKCGKHSLRSLRITWKECFPKYFFRKRKDPEYQASLSVFSPNNDGLSSYNYNECEFPQTEIPENMRKFKNLSIWYLDDEVLAFLDKIKPLFTEVFLNILSLSAKPKPTDNARIFFDHLLPMLASIRAIRCRDECIEFLEEHFPGTLALAKELEMFDDAKPDFIPAYLNWLTATQDFAVHGPRFLSATALSEIIIAIVNAVRQQFLAATASSAFVISLQLKRNAEGNFRVEEFSLENATTNEQLTVRNAIFEVPVFGDVYYVEILRHPNGADPKLRKWIEQREYFEKKYPFDEVEADDEHIWIKHPKIGRITKKKKGRKVKHAEDGSDDDDQLDEAGPSTSAKMMKK